MPVRRWGWRARWPRFRRTEVSIRQLPAPPSGTSASRSICTIAFTLDPALGRFLPATANIVRFQQRFELHKLREGPSSVFEFLFDRPDLDRVSAPDLSALPRDSQLRQAVIDRYAAGGVIRMGVGSIRIDPWSS